MGMHSIGSLMVENLINTLKIFEGVILPGQTTDIGPLDLRDLAFKNNFSLHLNWGGRGSFGVVGYIGPTKDGPFSLAGLFFRNFIYSPYPTVATFRSTSNNVATITTMGSHSLSVGDFVRLWSMMDSSYNGTFTVTGVPTSKSFTFDLDHADEEQTADHGYVERLFTYRGAIPIDSDWILAPFLKLQVYCIGSTVVRLATVWLNIQ
jgi:hypothetical protein